jgi:hypothetical protein
MATRSYFYQHSRRQSKHQFFLAQNGALLVRVCYANGVNVERRTSLLGVLARRDRMETDANAILGEPCDTDNISMALELVELLMD